MRSCRTQLALQSRDGEHRGPCAGCPTHPPPPPRCSPAVRRRGLAAMHTPRAHQNLPGARCAGGAQFTAQYGSAVGPGQGSYTRGGRHGQNGRRRRRWTGTQRRHSHLNPQRLLKVPLTHEDYLNSRMVAYPFCLYDCDIPVQGAVAIVTAPPPPSSRPAARPPKKELYGQRLDFRGDGTHRELSSYMDGGRSSSRPPGALGFPEGCRVAQIYDGFPPRSSKARVLRVLQGGRGVDFIRRADGGGWGELP